MSDAPRIKYKYRASATFNSNLLLWTLKDLWVFYSRYIHLCSILKGLLFTYWASIMEKSYKPDKKEKQESN